MSVVQSFRFCESLPPLNHLTRSVQDEKRKEMGRGINITDNYCYSVRAHKAKTISVKASSEAGG
jgi:hypothetical protein